MKHKITIKSLSWAFNRIYGCKTIVPTIKVSENKSKTNPKDNKPS